MRKWDQHFSISVTKTNFLMEISLMKQKCSLQTGTRNNLKTNTMEINRQLFIFFNALRQSLQHTTITISPNNRCNETFRNLTKLKKQNRMEGYSGILGNELANRLAEKAVKKMDPIQVYSFPSPQSCLKYELKKKLFANWHGDWNLN